MKKAIEIMKECFILLRPKEVLDLGCGNCKFSKKFLKKGANLTGVDKRDFKATLKGVNFINQDIRDFNFDKKYDLVFISMILHFLKREEAKKILKNVQKNTSIGGFNFLINMSDKEACKKENKNYFYPSIENLIDLYDGWEIIKKEYCLSKKHSHNGLKPHEHKIILLLARKKN